MHRAQASLDSPHAAQHEGLTGNAGSVLRSVVLERP